MVFTVGSMGMYEFLRMPYGLCNVPATLQCLMQNCLGELNLLPGPEIALGTLASCQQVTKFGML